MNREPWFAALGSVVGVNVLLPPLHLRHYQRPQKMDDPIRPVWFRVHRDHQYEPANVEARLLAERIREVEQERDYMEGALRFILQDAESWHGDDDEAKGRALAVIAAVARVAIPEAANSQPRAADAPVSAGKGPPGET